LTINFLDIATSSVLKFDLKDSAQFKRPHELGYELTQRRVRASTITVVNRDKNEYNAAGAALVSGTIEDEGTAINVNGDPEFITPFLVWFNHKQNDLTEFYKLAGSSQQEYGKMFWIASSDIDYLQKTIVITAAPTNGVGL